MTEIRLEGYRACARDGPYLRLGTWESYGIEQLQVIPGAGWEGLELTATFVTPAASVCVQVPEDGVLPVPPEATAASLGTAAPGKLVFAGMAAGVQRLSTDISFLVSDHAAAEGAQSQPTPSLWEQYFARIQAKIDAAVPPDGTPGTVLTKTDQGTAWREGGAAGGYQIGAGLKLDTLTNTLAVDTTNDIGQDNTLPVTSAAVYTAVGNIDALLTTI